MEGAKSTSAASTTNSSMVRSMELTP
jgi:hypothetical protein